MRIVAALVVTLFASTALAKTPTCPGNDFPSFLKAFSENSELQRRFTQFPFTITLPVHYALVHEPLIATAAVQTEEEVVFPIAPSKAEQESGGLTESIESHGETHIVQYRKDDTDEQFRLYFTQQKHCWYLTRMEDDSL